MKRPGSRFIQNINDNADGRWFSYYRTEEEQYLGHIQTNGFVRFWNVTDGTASTHYPLNQETGADAGQPVTATSTGDCYLTHVAREDLQTCTINDFTFITNRGTRTDAQGNRTFYRSPRLLGSPLATNGAITRPGIGAAAGINVVAGRTNNAVGNASVAANQNQPTTLTQMNVPVDLGINDNPREDPPITLGLTSVWRTSM